MFQLKTVYGECRYPWSCFQKMMQCLNANLKKDKFYTVVEKPRRVEVYGRNGTGRYVG